MNLIIGNESLPPTRIFCIGRNYIKHAKELNNEIPSRPVIFMKPFTSLVPVGNEIQFPKHGKDLHYESEIVILIGREGYAKSIEESDKFIKGLSLGLDLTLSDVQKELKQKGLPWEISKSFEQSAAIGKFVQFSPEIDLENIEFRCFVNGELRQTGNSQNMIFPIKKLIFEISKIWKLLPGDLIYTGTPEGVGSLKKGDKIKIRSKLTGSFSWISK